MFIGSKLLLVFVGVHIPVETTLFVVMTVLAVSIFAPIYFFPDKIKPRHLYTL